MKLVIYTDVDFNIDQGGIVVQYYLASLLSNCGVDVQIRSPNNIPNILYNKWYTGNDINDDTFVLYSEGFEGNPTGAKHVIRWILADLGIFSPIDIYKTWGPNDLIYNFKTTLKIFYISPDLYNIGNPSRKEYCYALRKSFMHDAQNVTPPIGSYGIMMKDNYFKIFNEYTYFICYDPYTFLIWIAPVCGCITIVHPYKGLTRDEWFLTIGLPGYGIAYGYEPSEIEYAKSTLHLVKENLNKSINCNNDDTISSFIKLFQNS